MMKFSLPGRVARFEEVKLGEIFQHITPSDKMELAIKSIYGEADKEHCIVLNDGPFLSSNSYYARNRPLLVLDDLEIVPDDLGNFTQPPIHTGLIGAGWLGATPSSGPVLAFAIPGGQRPVGFVDLSSGELLDEPPEALWFKGWRITIPGLGDRETLYEFERHTE